MESIQINHNKLHLGCGSVHLPGYLNVDIQDGPAVDLCCDIRELQFRKCSFDLIYACAVIEHFGRHEWQKVLEHWGQFLKPGGILRISTTDFKACAEHYLNNGNISLIQGLVIGGQKDQWDWHGVIFDFKSLEAALLQLGYEDVRRYDWRKTDVGECGIDDYSQAYLPHMDKENGQLMALNVEATKI